MTKQTEFECCPPFDKTLWDNKTFEWDNKLFIKDNVCAVFNIPMNFGTVMRRLDSKVQKATAFVPDWLCLSDHTSSWNMDLYLAVDKNIVGAKNVILSGIFFSKVYEGSFKDTGKWFKDFISDVKTKGLTINKIYTWYTTCPKCAKKYGKNYVVLVGKIE